MSSEAVVKIADLAGGGLCVASEDGEKVHDAIVQALRDGQEVRLSFEDVTDLTSAFLNAAVGQLYGEFPEEEIRAKLLPPSRASREDLVLLKRVVERAKDFFRNPEPYERAVRDALGREDA